MNIEAHESRLIAITYNLKRTTKTEGFADDQEAEYDSPQTIAAISEAISALGHDVVVLEANNALPARLLRGDIDVVFNIAEGYGGRNREAHVPALLEMLDIPFTGSDSKALTLTLDKALAKKIVAGAGIVTPKALIFNHPTHELPPKLTYPLIVKPLAEGSSKGISHSSVVHDSYALHHAIEAIVQRYEQPALVEQFVGGREFTIGVLENTALEVLPPMEIVYLHDDPCPVYSYAYKLEWQEFLRYDTNPELSKTLKARLESYAARAFKALGCRDVARFDFRMDHKGQLHFLECNALPGLAPNWSDLCLISAAAGISHSELIHRILSPALRRLASPL